MNVASTELFAPKGIFVNNRWQACASGRSLPVIAPAEGKPFAAIAAGNAEDVDRAVAAARAALEQGAWGRMAAVERGRLLAKLAVAVADNAELLAQLEARDTGKPMKQARADMVAGSPLLRILRRRRRQGAWPDHPVSSTASTRDRSASPMGSPRISSRGTIPRRCSAASSAPALAMGNACVMKPAEDACLTPLRFAETCHGSGLPRRRDQHRHRPRRRGRRCAVVPSGHRLHLLHRMPEVGTLVQKAAAERHYRLHAGARRQIAADRVRRCRRRSSRGPYRRSPSCRTPARPARREPRVLIERTAYDKVRRRARRAFARSRPARPRWISTAGPSSTPARGVASKVSSRAARKAGMPVLAEGGAAGVPTSGYLRHAALFGPVPR